jgi:hypothetical protein
MRNYRITYDSIEGPLVYTIMGNSIDDAISRFVLGLHKCKYTDVKIVERLI